MHPTPGITRDYQSFKVKDYKFPFMITDTGGIMDPKVITKDRYSLISDWKAQRKKQGKVGSGTWDDEKPEFFWSDVFSNILAPLRETDILLFVVDARSGITQTDFAIRDWIKKNVVQRCDLKPNEINKELVAFTDSGEKDNKIYVEKVYLVANKCDDGQTFDSENDLY